MRKLLLATVASIAFAAPSTLSFAATTADAPGTLAQALMQAQLEKCIANNILSLDQVKVMTDDELTKALEQCAMVLAQQTAPAPVVRTVAAPVVVPAPVIVDRPVRVHRRFVDGGNTGSFNGVGNGGTIDVGGIGNVNGNGNAGGGINLGQLGDVLGNLGGGAGGGGAGAGNNNAGAGDGGVPVPKGIDGRIAGLQSGLAEGIQSGAITPAEAQEIGGRIALIQSTRATLGDNATARLLLNQQLDRAAADFNTKVRNTDGIQDPDLFRALKRKGANGLTTAALGDQKGPMNFRDRLLQRFGKTGTPTNGLSPASSGPKSAFERFKDGLAKRRVAGNTGIAGGLQTGKANSPALDRIRNRLSQRSNTAGSATSGFDRLKKMAQRRAGQQSKVSNAASSGTQHHTGTRVFLKKVAQQAHNASATGGSGLGAAVKRRLASR